MNAPELKSMLQLLLVNELGSYTFANGAGVAPAIVVQDDDETISGRSPEGLEIVIRSTPIRNSQAMYGAVRRIKTWQLYLKQWGGRRTIESAIDILDANFPGIKIIPIASKTPGGPSQQVSVRIPDALERA